jgi:hypothetical protein
MPPSNLSSYFALKMIQGSVTPWQGAREKAAAAGGALLPPRFSGSSGPSLYRRLNEVLDQAGFDEFCEAGCHKFYPEKLGRPSLVPGVYFRVMLIGFF